MITLLSKLLRENNVTGHISQLKKDRVYQTVLKHIYHLTLLQDIKDELLSARTQSPKSNQRKAEENTTVKYVFRRF